MNIFDQFEMLDLINLDEMMWNPPPAAYSISVSPGSHTLTGSPIALKAARALAVQAGAHTLAGSQIGLTGGRKIEMANGTMTLSGASVSLRCSRVIDLGSGILTLAGSAIALNRRFPSSHISNILQKIITNKTKARPLSATDFDVDITRLADAIGNIISGHVHNALDSRELAHQRYWIGGSGAWSDRAHWAIVSGGDGGLWIPTEEDDVYFDRYSFAGEGHTVSFDVKIFYAKSLTMSDMIHSCTFDKASGSTGQWTLAIEEGIVTAYKVTIKNSHVIGGAAFNAAAANGCVDGGNNTGWNFS